MTETQARWQAAQQYEAGYWLQQASAISNGTIPQLDFYEWRSDQLVKQLSALGHDDLTNGGAHIIEVGCGPVGVGACFPAAYRLLVDPLEPTYSANEVLSKMRNPEADYREGSGEALPAPDDRFDLVIIENCIDHVQDVDAVMVEVLRVVKPTGLVYLTVNNRSSLGYWIHRLLSRTRIDPGHPHTFTPRRFRRLLERHDLRIEGWQVESYWDALLEDFKSPNMKDKAKALLGVSEYIVSAIASVER